MKATHQSTSAVRSTVAALGATCCLLLLTGCGSGDPFAYVQVSGKVTYEDGSPIPADQLVLTFIPQGGSLDAKTHPRPGVATVDRATGEFRDVTSHKVNDGLVRGKHKVTLSGANHSQLKATVVPPEYADPDKTPLMVDTADQPFVLKVRKPM
jgi:hypothetical protein